MKIAGKALITLAFAITAVSCIGPSTMTPVAKHSLGSSVEGTYTVSVGSEILGHLKLDNNSYSFVLEKGVQVPSAANHLFFVEYPEGDYSLDYYASVEPDTPLEDLEYRESRAILSYIRFNSDQAGSLTDTTAKAIDYLFVIISDKQEQQLDFAPVAAKIQEWTATKPWN